MLLRDFLVYPLDRYFRFQYNFDFKIYHSFMIMLRANGISKNELPSMRELLSLYQKAPFELKQRNETKKNGFFEFEDIVDDIYTSNIYASVWYINHRTSLEDMLSIFEMDSIYGITPNCTHFHIGNYTDGQPISNGATIYAKWNGPKEIVAAGYFNPVPNKCYYVNTSKHDGYWEMEIYAPTNRNLSVIGGIYNHNGKSYKLHFNEPYTSLRIVDKI